MTMSLAPTVMSLLVIWLAMSTFQTLDAHGVPVSGPPVPDPNPQNRPVSDPNAQNQNRMQFETLLEGKIQVAFKTIEQGNQIEGQKMLEIITTLFMRFKSLPHEDKMACLSNIMIKVKKSLNRQTQLIAEDFLGGLQMGVQIIKKPQGTAASTPSSQNGPQNEQFVQLLDQTLQTAFQKMEQGNQPEAKMKLEAITSIFMRFDSMPQETKLAKLTEIVLNIKKSLNRECQAAADEYLLGVQIGVKIVNERQQGTVSVPSGQPGTVSVPSGQQGTWNTGQQGTVSVPSGQQGTVTVPSGQQGTWNTGQQGTVSVPSGQQGTVSVPSGQQGTVTVPSGQQGTVTVPSGQQGSENEQFLLQLEQNLRIAFQKIQEGNQFEAQKSFEVTSGIFTRCKSMPHKEKMAKLTEIVLKIKKSLDLKAQAVCEDFLGGVQMGVKIVKGHQENTVSGPFGLVAVQNQQFVQLLQQNLKVAFQKIEEGNQIEAQTRLRAIFPLFTQFKSMPQEEKMTNLFGIMLNIKKPVDKETQSAAAEYLLGMQMGVTINEEISVSGSTGHQSSQTTYGKTHS